MSGKKVVKQTEESDNPEKRSNLTPQVLKLVEKQQGVNPVIAAGKSVIPAKLRGKQPLSKVLKQQYHQPEQSEKAVPDEEDNADTDADTRNGQNNSGETEVLNLTELVIREEAPQILDRFNACSCEKCVEVFSRMVAPKIPVRYARVPKSSGSQRREELVGRSESVRRQVVDVMTRELVGTKNRCFHEMDDEEQK